MPQLAQGDYVDDADMDQILRRLQAEEDAKAEAMSLSDSASASESEEIPEGVDDDEAAIAAVEAFERKEKRKARKAAEKDPDAEMASKCTQFLAEYAKRSGRGDRGDRGDRPGDATMRPRNFVNEGHTCYISSSLQMLASIPQFTAHVKALVASPDRFMHHLGLVIESVIIQDDQTRIDRGSVSELVDSWNLSAREIAQIDPNQNDDPFVVVPAFVHYLIVRSPVMRDIFLGCVEPYPDLSTLDTPLLVMLLQPGIVNRRTNLLDMLADWALKNNITVLRSVIFFWFAGTPGVVTIPVYITATAKGQTTPVQTYKCRSVICYIDAHYVAYVIKGKYAYLCDDTHDQCEKHDIPTQAGKPPIVPIRKRHLRGIRSGIKFIAYSLA